MAIKITVEGVELEVSSVSEALELIRGLKTSSARPLQAQSSKMNGNGYITPAGAVDWAVQLLTAIRASGSEGLTTPRVVEILGLKHLKAVGGRMAIVNKLLEHKGYRVGSIYTNDKDHDGKRLWKAKSQLDNALISLRKNQ